MSSALERVCALASLIEAQLADAGRDWPLTA
jgi:hypothetical protein